VNDREGHATGDEVLRRVARTLLGSVRATDAVFRIGAMNSRSVLEQERTLGLEIAKRLCQAVAAQRRAPQLPSVSAGVASFPSDADSKPQLLHHADIALYAAKDAGKSAAAL